MVKIKEFSIKLDDEKDSYFAGEKLSGQVVLHLNDQVPVLRLELLIEGTANCSVGSCQENIFKNDIVMFNSLPGSQNSGSHQHPAGKQTYRFHIQLPKKLPSSVKERNGMIEYWMKAKVEFTGVGFKSFLSTTQKLRKRFVVKERIDANKPNYQLVNVKNCRKIPGVFTNNTKLEKEDLLIALKRGVCCPEENIEVSIQYKQVVTRKMGLVKLRLNKYIQFNKKENRPPQKRVVTEMTEPKRSSMVNQRVVTIKIPENTAPTNTLTNSVVITYVLHVKVEGYKEVKLPVIIGTIPYGSGVDHTQNASEVPPQNPSTSTNDTLMHQRPYAPSVSSTLRPSGAVEYDQANAPPIHHFTGYIGDSPPVLAGYEGEIQCEFFHPPAYIPDDDFDLPPSYEEALDSVSNVNRLVEAH